MTAWEIDDEFGHALDLVVDCGGPEGLGSTVLDFTGEAISVVREGLGKWPI